VAASVPACPPPITITSNVDIPEMYAWRLGRSVARSWSPAPSVRVTFTT
jgi:hypothetical protein